MNEDAPRNVNITRLRLVTCITFLGASIIHDLTYTQFYRKTTLIRPAVQLIEISTLAVATIARKKANIPHFLIIVATIARLHTHYTVIGQYAAIQSKMKFRCGLTTLAVQVSTHTLHGDWPVRCHSIKNEIPLRKQFIL